MRSSRRTSCAPHSASEVAFSTGSSSRCWYTLTPKPTTTPSGWTSHSTPQTLRHSSSSTRTSLGHFSPAWRPATSATARSTASPVSSGTHPMPCDGAGTSTETAIDVPGGASQERPSRPRPALW